MAVFSAQLALIEEQRECYRLKKQKLLETLSNILLYYN